MIRIIFGLAFICLLMVVGVAYAAPPATVTISSVGPGTKNGDLSVSGTFTTMTGWQPTQLRIQVSPKAGGTCNTYNVPGNPPTSPWSTLVAGLKSGTEYSVIASLRVTAGIVSKDVLSDPKSGKAK